MKKIVFFFGFILCIACLAEANEQLCLGDICLGDPVEKLKNQTWISVEKLKLIKLRDIPSGRTSNLINHSQANMFSIENTQSKQDYRLTKEKEFISKYVLGINDNEKQSLNPYYSALFFDAIALNIIDKVIACKTIRLNAFKMTNDGNIDTITIAPLPSTGKFEVDSVYRQFPKMDKPQNEALISTLKTKYPSMKSVGEASVSRDERDVVMIWGEMSGAVFLSITKILQDGMSRGKITTRLATDLWGKKEPNYDDPLMRNQPCSSSFSQAPKINID